MFTSLFKNIESTMTLCAGDTTISHILGTVPMKDSYTLKKAESVNLMNTIITQTRDDDLPSISSSMGGEERDKESLQESGSIYNWQAVLNQIRADPSLAKIAVDGVLPLHAACGDGASIDVIKFLLEEYPEAAQAKCDKGYLPIFWHLELNTKSPSEQVLLALLEAYPGAAAVVNPQNQLPIHLACKAHGVSEKIFATLLCANPEGAYVCDDDGKYPVDYAVANDNEATKGSAYNAFSKFLKDETFVNLLDKTLVDLKAAPLASLKVYAPFVTCGVINCLQGIDDEEERLDFVETDTEFQQSLLEAGEVSTNNVDAVVSVSQSHSDISTYSEVSKKSSKSPQDIALPVARSCSGSSIKSEASKKSSSAQDIAVQVARSHSGISTFSEASKKSSKSAQDVTLPVARSRSDISTYSEASKKSSKSPQDIALPVARSRSGSSIKSEASKKSSSAQDIAVQVARSHSGISTFSEASKKSSKSAQDVTLPVARSRSDISTYSEASKKSSKSAQDVALPVARSRSGSSTKSQILNNTTNVEEPEKAEVAPTEEESSTSDQISKASRQSIRSAKSPVRRDSKLLFQLGCNVTKSADEKAATNEESAEVLPNPILKNSSTPKSKSTLRKMKGFLTRKLKKVS